MLGCQLMTTPSPSKSPTKYTSLMYRPPDAYPEKQLQIRADLRAKQATSGWNTEAQTAYASTAQTSTSDKRATMRKGRVVDESTPTNVVADPTSVSSRHGCTRHLATRAATHAAMHAHHPAILADRLHMHARRLKARSQQSDIFFAKPLGDE